MIQKTLITCMAFICLFAGHAADKPEKPVYKSNVTADSLLHPNILWILSEDISVDLHCYGAQLVQTPTLDKLTADGMRFTNAFTTSPVCSPSRSAMITGMYQTTIDVQNHRSHRDDGYMLPAPVKPITEYLRAAGYFTANMNHPAPGVNTRLKTDFNFKPGAPVYDGNDWSQRKPGQPFFAQLTIDETHRGKEWSTTVKARQPRIDPQNIKLPPYYADEPAIRADWATYLESIQLMDDYVAAILKRLEDEGLADNTLVIFIGDNGRCMMRDKQFLYDGGLHIPLIVRWPAKLKGRQVNDNMISAIDISATILKVAGVDPPAYMEGKPFLGSNISKRDYIIGARDRMDETIDRMRSVRTKKFNYIKNFMPERPYMQPNKYKETMYPAWNLMKQLYTDGKLTPEQALFCAPTKPAEELYDVETDPFEIHNLAGNDKYKQQLIKMRKILDDWIQQTGDKGQFPEAKIWLPKNAQ